MSAATTRRAFMGGATALAGAVLAGCTRGSSGTGPGETGIGQRYLAMYAAMPEERFPIPAVDLSQVSPEYLRQEVVYTTPEPAGTIVVDTAGPFLYLVRGDGTALRYGIGVGREGFEWSGSATIQMKRAWPTWTPPAEMIARQPELEQYRDGQEPGLNNPLGARALYLFQDGRDTLYRLHGTNEVWSIGRSMSSGCIRLLNQDVIDLYGRVPVGTRVVVRQHDRRWPGRGLRDLMS